MKITVHKKNGVIHTTEYLQPHFNNWKYVFCLNLSVQTLCDGGYSTVFSILVWNEFYQHNM